MRPYTADTAVASKRCVSPRRIACRAQIVERRPPSFTAGFKASSQLWMATWTVRPSMVAMLVVAAPTLLLPAMLLGVQ